MNAKASKFTSITNNSFNEETLQNCDWHVQSTQNSADTYIVQEGHQYTGF